MTQFNLGDIAVDVVFKDIKNIHLSVYPPIGKVRVSAPLRMELETIRVFTLSKLGWIKQQQQRFLGQERETPREYLARESHYVWGKRYLLKLLEKDEAPEVELEHSHMLLHVRPGASEETKQAIVALWYREQVKSAVSAIIAKWEPIMGEGGARLCAEDEDEMGKLQPRFTQHPPQHRTCQKAKGVP